MIHPKTELKFISREVGYGVIATEFIPKGTITWALDKLDRTFEPAEAATFDKIYRDIFDTYCFRNSEGKLVLCWDIARFVNHSFHSNCLTTAYDFEIAIRDIQPGVQLTDDYGYLNIDEPFRGIDEGTRRKVVYPDDLLKYHKVWDKQLLDAFKDFEKCDQPLRTLLSESTWKKSIDISRGKREMDSILNCHYSNGKASHPEKI